MFCSDTDNPMYKSQNIIHEQVQGKNEELLNNNENLYEVIQNWVTEKEWKKITELWVNGLDLDWNYLHSKVKSRRISLPTYSFEKANTITFRIITS